MSSLPSAPSTSAANASTRGPDSPTRGPRTSPPGLHTPPPIVVPDGEDTAPLERLKAEPPPPASSSEDPSPPQPQPQSDPEPEPEADPDPAAIAAEAENLKVQGNESFKRARYGEAIDLYTKAIGMFVLVLVLVSPPFPFHPQCLLRLADPLIRNDHIKTWSPPNRHTSLIAQRPTSPSSVSAQRSQTANSPTPSKQQPLHPPPPPQPSTPVRHTRHARQPNPNPNPSPRLHPSPLPNPNQKPFSDSHAANSPSHKLQPRSPLSAICSRRSRPMRRRRRCRPGRSSWRRTCVIWKRPVGVGSGPWRASPSIGVCALWRLRGARYLLSGGYGALRSSLREGTGMPRIAQQSVSFRSFFFYYLSG